MTEPRKSLYVDDLLSGTTSKARSAKQNLTIPRIKLVSARMTCNIVDNARNALGGFPVQGASAWLDSTVPLHWIKGGGEHEQFIANRVQKINSKADIEWRYVPTDCSPADVGSRGWQGIRKQVVAKRTGLAQSKIEWPEDIVTKSMKESKAEVKIIKAVLGVTKDGSDCFDHTLEKFSLLRKAAIMCA